MEKWRGTSKTNKFPEGKQGSNKNGDMTTAEETVPGSKIISLLLEHDVQLMLGTINAYMHEGPVLSWLSRGRCNRPFDLSTYDDFGVQDGHQQGRQICHTTMSDTCFAGIFQQANKP
eukprot:13755529-Ditylum_brightwellii.AAC.1